jgi:pimeloyl-ACP methyl ester carboxylesterase
MKLAQRIAIGYYKTKINALSFVSMKKATALTVKLFCTPYSGRRKLKAPAIFNHANKINFLHEGNTIHGWQWLPKQPNGKKVLIVHGFDSYTYKFEPYVQPFLTSGFEVLAFDAPAHGISEGETVNALILKDCLLQINAHFGPLHGVIGHSFGGLAASLAALQLPQLQKLVLVAPATESSSALASFFKVVKVNSQVQLAVKAYIEEIAQQPISQISVTHAVQQLQLPILWLHDEEDTICPIQDVQQTMQKQLPHITFHVTKGLGHSKIYRDATVKKMIVAFM